MAISDADLGGRGWYSVRLRILDEQPECGKSMVVRKRDMGYELISLSGLFGSVSLYLSRNWLARCSGSARCCNGAVASRGRVLPSLFLASYAVGPAR